MQKLFAILIGLLICGCAAHESAKSHTVRQRFVPTCDPKACKTCGGGASWSRLVPAPDQPGVLWARAWAGIGDKFPVQDEDGQTLFEVVLAEGNDDHLVVEVRCKDSSQRIDLPRDKSASLEVAGSKYELFYPSVHVSSADEPTTNKAFLIVTHRP